MQILSYPAVPQPRLPPAVQGPVLVRVLLDGMFNGFLDQSLRQEGEGVVNTRIPVCQLQAGDFLAAFNAAVASVAESPRYKGVYTIALTGGHELRGLPGDELVEITDPGVHPGDLMIFADELRPGDRDILRGLVVVAVRNGARPEGVEVEYVSDGGMADTWHLHERELCHVIRPDPGPGEDHDDLHVQDYDPDTERW